ncbi:MAG: hypothetical protein DRJ42_10020 [Deltaproteobacteria bacterium]|nr:MAG: hypothetical protein DRJ42_10020 [Deltaproteobacteria bacterium]
MSACFAVAEWFPHLANQPSPVASPRKTLTRFDDYREMLSDAVRMEAYREAIAAVVRPGDVVVDLGAGLGILSFLAVRAGAEKVYAIEQGGQIELARALAAKNGLASRIEFIEDNSKRVTLPAPANVLLSETLGSFGVDENTLDFTLDARERLLEPGGRMIPEALELFLAPVELPEDHSRVAFWNDVEGFDFSPAIDELMSRMSLSRVAPGALLSEAQSFYEIDLRTHREVTLERKLLFQMQRPGVLHGLAGWFEVALSADVSFATSPSSPSTHWQQAFFPFRQPVSVTPGDFLEVVFAVGPKAEHSDDTRVSYDYRCTQRANEGKAAQPPVPSPVARNAPCPCGSGKKFKRCCGRA